MTAAPNTPEPPPEGELIRVARLARGLSPEGAAARAQIKLGGARWRQIERGYKTRDETVRAPAGTLAHMAHAVAVPPDQLEGAGRPDAASILREIIRSEGDHTEADTPLSTREEEALAEMVASAADGFGLTPGQMDVAYARARQIIAERRQARSEGQDGSTKPRAS